MINIRKNNNLTLGISLVRILIFEPTIVPVHHVFEPQKMNDLIFFFFNYCVFTSGIRKKFILFRLYIFNKIRMFKLGGCLT